MNVFRRHALAVGLWIIAIASGPTGPVRGQRTNANPEVMKAELVVQTGHTLNLRSITFSPDGRYLASGGNDKTIKLWEIATGRELKTFAGHKGEVSSIAFSPDSRTIASAGYDGTLKLWDISSGTMLATTADPLGYVTAMDSVAFSPDGSRVAVSQLDPPDSRITVYDSRTLQQVYSIVGGSVLWALIAFSPDGNILAGSENQETVKLWNARTGEPLKTITGPVYDQFKHNTADIVFSADGKTIATGGSDGVARIWDVAKGTELKSFKGHTNRVSAVAFAADGKRLVTASWDKSIRFWDIESGRETEPVRKTNEYISDTALQRDGSLLAIAEGKDIRVWDLSQTNGEPMLLTGNVFLAEGVALSPDGTRLVVGEYGNRIGIWDIVSQTRIRILPGRQSSIRKLVISPDGNILATGGGFADGKIMLWNMATGEAIRTLPGHENTIYALAFSPDGKILASGGHDQMTRLWEVANGRLIKELKDTSRDGLANEVRALTFTADGKSVIRSAFGGMVMWNVATGAVEKNMMGTGVLDTIALSADGRYFGGRDLYEKQIRAWDLVTGAMVHDLPNTFASRETMRQLIPDITFDDEAASSKFVFRVEENRKVKMFDRVSNTEIASLVGFYGEGWAVVTPDGLFDASSDARKRLHYVLGLEAVTLDQMKDVYYVPGLLRKLFTAASLPKIGLFSSKDLFPQVEFDPPKEGDKTLAVRVTNRGGGIGQVQVLVNGKEFVRDARPPRLDPNAKQIELTISLKDAPIASGGKNRIEIVARNAAGSLTGRGTRGAADEFVTSKPAGKPVPNIYLIAGGISKYAAENLNLNFAAKDAADFAKAVDVGAVKLLKGDRSKVHIRLLTSGTADVPKFTSADAKTYTATKADFVRAFTDFKNATADDVFIVYLAGHGTSIGQGGEAVGNSYLYLTQEATTTDRSVLAVENARRAMTVSSDELKDMMKQNKALKQVLILDTCAAGAASGSFVAKRDVPADQIGALERLKDNTGFYILMGSAADAVSYEASQYGQGLLTYSLLQGMKGARLRDDQFADVELLFGYAKESVGNLARHVGGIQRPETITPDSSRSFDIGEFTPAERSQINTLANPVPLVLRPRLSNSKMRYDNLGLERLLRAELRRHSLVTAGAIPKLMFVESDDMPDAFLPSGDYSTDGDVITITLVLVRNGSPVGREIVVTGAANEKEAIVRELIGRIAEAARR